MATATKVHATVLVSEERVTGVTLALSIEEAQTLLEVLERVGGSPKDTARRYTNSIQDALKSEDTGAGLVPVDEQPDMDSENLCTTKRAIYFAEGSDKALQKAAAYSAENMATADARLGEES